MLACAASMTVEETFSYLRRDARDREKKFYYAFVVDPEETTSWSRFLSRFVLGPPRSVDRGVSCGAMSSPRATIWTRRRLSDLFARHNLMMIPIVDADSAY